MLRLNIMPKKKKIDKDRATDRSRDFLLLLYPENELHQLAYLKLTSGQYSALGVLHDKDKYTDDKIDEETGKLIHSEGDLKKEHYHFYVCFNNPRRILAIADELNIEEHLIDFCNSNFKSNAEYFLHWGKHGGAGKYTYDVDDFVGTLKSSAIQKLSNEPQDLKFYKIVRFIRQYSGFINYGIVYDWCFENGYQNVCLRYMSHIKEFIYIHNEKYYSEKR